MSGKNSFHKKTFPNKLYQFYLYLVYNNFATLRDMSDLFNVNRKTIMRWVNKLRQSGLVLIKSTKQGYFVEGYKEWGQQPTLEGGSLG